jgi:hypothetical protein
MDMEVGIATGYGTGRQMGRSSSTGRSKNFLFSVLSRQVLGPTQLPIQREPAALPVVKRPEREADHSPPVSADVKNCRTIPPLPPASSCRCA